MNICTKFFTFQDIQFPRLIIFGQGATGTRLLVLLLLVLCPASLLLRLA
jgi:hypothetical protein